MNIYRSKQKPSTKQMKTYSLRKALYAFLPFNVCFLSIAMLYCKGSIPLQLFLIFSSISFIIPFGTFHSKSNIYNRIVYKVVVDEENEEILFYYFRVFPRIEKIKFADFHYDCVIYPDRSIGGQIIVSKVDNSVFPSINRFILQDRDYWDECTWDVQELIDLSVCFDKVRNTYRTWDPYKCRKPQNGIKEDKGIWSKRWSEEDYQRIRIIGPQF